MSQDKNDFGGRAGSLYVPMTELEQEAISRLVEAGDLQVHILEWGIVNNPRIVFGDARVSFFFRLDFDRPEVPMDVYYFDLELRTGSGQLLFGPDRQSVEYGGKPFSVAAGVFVDMVWDIQVMAMDPRLVKALTGARGLTSRLQDRDTKEISLMGNMSLDSRKKDKIVRMRQGERAVKQSDRLKVDEAARKQGR